MANKPIIEIEVQDEAFKRFLELFNDYSAKLDEMPQAWRDLGSAMGEGLDGLKGPALTAKEQLAAAGAQAALIADALKHAAKAQDGLTHATGKGRKGMDGLAKSAQGVGKAISLLGGWVLKIGALGGLGALFSGFGIGELASAGFSRYRAAGRLGISPGQLASFGVNAQQFLGPGALESAANAQIDITKAGSLAAMGIDYRHATTESPAALAFEELRKAARAYRANPRIFANTPVGIAYQQLGGNFGDVRNAALHPRELALAEERYRANIKALEIPRKEAQEWANLKIALDKAGVTIETVLIDKLASLAPYLGTMTSEITRFITDFVGSKEFTKDVRDVEDGLKGLVHWLGDPNTIAGVKLLSSEILSVAQKLKWLVPAPKKGDKGLLNTMAFGRGQDAKSYFSWSNWIKRPEKDFHRFLGWMNQPFPQTYAGKAWSWLSSPIARPAGEAVLKVAVKKGVNPILALATALQEDRSLNPKIRIMDHYANGAPAGYSTGLFQLNEHGEGAGMTLRQLTDAATNAKVAISEIAAVAKKHPDWSPGRIAAAAQRPAHPEEYAREVNARYLRLEKDLPADWRSHLPKDLHPRPAPAHVPESVDHAKAILKSIKAMQGRRVQKPVHVAITNSTAARVAVSLNAVAVA